MLRSLLWFLYVVVASFSKYEDHILHKYYKGIWQLLEMRRHLLLIKAIHKGSKEKLVIEASTGSIELT